MRYHSLSSHPIELSFSEAVIQGQATDGGLFFPQTIPKEQNWHSLAQSLLTPADIAIELLAPMLRPDVDQETLHKICQKAFNFEIPLIQLDEQLWVLELFHGPSAAFKDIGARFLSRLLSYISSTKLTILVATSGDTGGAVASGFHQVPNIEVVILYPKGRVSPLQEKQLTCWGDNITALAVEGSFDDCQAMVKAMLSDQQVRQKRALSSANSINLARWLPQATYYAWASAQLQQAPYFVVPSGNLGNLAAGIFAWRRGMSTKGFIAATNRNDVFTHYLQNGQYQAKKSVHTPSNAMDVGNPSNHPRIEALFDHDLSAIRTMVKGIAIDDEQTLASMKHANQQYQYIFCPHGAVAFAAYQQLSSVQRRAPHILLATAHPAKFKEVVEPVLNQVLPLPQALAHLKDAFSLPKKSLKPTAQALKDFLLSE